MTVYLLHLDEPLPCGIRNGRTIYSGHYLGYAEDLVGRIIEHQETTWEPFDEPIILENGKKCLGVKHGPGATFMGVVNYKGIPWRLAEQVRAAVEQYLTERGVSWRDALISMPANYVTLDGEPTFLKWDKQSESYSFLSKEKL